MIERFRRDGFVILESVLSRAECEDIARALQPHEDAQDLGRNDFEGRRTKRVYSLAAKGDVFMRLAEHPRVMELVEQVLLPNWLLSTMQSICIYPGEARQAWHTDDAFYIVPRPHATLAVSTIWAIDDFTADNGATEVIAGSHLWGAEHPDETAHEVTKAVMPAGSVIVFDGSTWHRGGDNHSQGTRRAVSPQYCQPWLRPQESQLLIVPPEAAKRCSPRGRSMLGYSIHPPFIGQVEGRHPLRLVDPEYRTHKTDAAKIADLVLERPVSTFEAPRKGR